MYPRSLTLGSILPFGTHQIDGGMFESSLDRAGSLFDVRETNKKQDVCPFGLPPAVECRKWGHIAKGRK